MRFGNVSIIQLLGLVNFGLLFFQLATGLRWLKMPLGIHKKTGIALVVAATLHGLLAFFTAN